MASKVYYNIDLAKVFNRVYGKKSAEWKAAHYEYITQPDFKNVFGIQAIDTIRDRTENKNIDMNNKDFPAYKSSYIKSFIFNLYGKSKSNVNLTLTGNMLAALNTVLLENTKLAIEVVGDPNDRAHGHMNGIKTKSGKVKRQFLGLPKSEEDKILKELFKNIGDTEIEKQARTQVELPNQAFENIDIEFEDENA